MYKALFILLLPLTLLAEPLFFILLGAPGAGKGTQGQKLSEYFHIPHIALGDLLREEVEKKTGLGLLASSYMEKGELVPDDLVLSMLKMRLNSADCAQGAVLDGTSRKRSQAEFLLANLPKGKYEAIYFSIDRDLLKERILGRKVCSKCSFVCHETLLPEKEKGFCDRCSSVLIQRKDDNMAAFLQRLAIFEEYITGVCDFYKEMGILRSVNAAEPIELLFQSLK